MHTDRYGTFDYSALINWNERLPREWKFLESVLASAPSRSLLDLGSGTGEHARFLASKGFEVVGIDASPAMIEKARASGGATFIEGDMRDVASLVDRQFGAALCLGNALPQLTEGDDLRRFADGLRRVLLPGGVFVAQMLNYDRYERKNERALPLSFLPDGVIFLRTMELRPDGRVIFMPTILRERPDAEPPVELIASQRVELRGWRRADVEQAFSSAGFAVEIFGSYARQPFEAEESRDVVAVARLVQHT